MQTPQPWRVDIFCAPHLSLIQLPCRPWFSGGKSFWDSTSEMKSRFFQVVEVSHERDHLTGLHKFLAAATVSGA